MESSPSEPKPSSHGLLYKIVTVALLLVVLLPVDRSVWRTLGSRGLIPNSLMFWSPHSGRNPTGWTEGALAGRTLEEIRARLDCARLGPRPIPDRAVWMFLRGAYQGVVGPARSSLAGPFADPPHGFAVDFEVRQTPDKGRGLFATQDIPKGALVYTSAPHAAKFHSAGDFRRFLEAIPQDLACDATLWMYVEEFQEGGLTIMVELDEGSLFNDGGWTQGSVGCDAEAAKVHPGGCEVNYFALRDIRAGEELLCIYAEFEPQDGLARFGLK